MIDDVKIDVKMSQNRLNSCQSPKNKGAPSSMKQMKQKVNMLANFGKNTHTHRISQVQVQNSYH